MLPLVTCDSSTVRGLFFVLLCTSLVVFSSHNTNAQPSNTTEKKYIFTIEPQGLLDALQEYGLTANLQLVTISKLFENKSSPALVGEYTAREAIELLLSGTDLSYEFISRDVLVIKEGTGDRQVAQIGAAALPAQQGTNLEVEVVTVTGTRVPRTEFDVPYPTQTISAIYLERESATTIGDAINSLPVMCESEYSLNVSGNAGNIGEAYGDLYCLGSQRTLTLINGRRTISSNDPSAFNTEPGLQVDLNMIPQIMMKSIEVIGVGSAPVYGSDAVAGTINILLKENFEGLDLALQQSQSALRDTEQQNLGVLLGKNFNDVNGNITLAYEYHKQRGLAAADREYTQRDRNYVFTDPNPNDPFARDYQFENDIVNPLISAGGVPTPSNGPPLFALGRNAFFDGNFEPFIFGESGELRLFNRGTLTRSLDQRVGGDGVREQLFRTLRVPIERHVLNLTTHFGISSNTEAFAEIQYYQNSSSSISSTGDVVPTQLNARPSEDSPITSPSPGVNDTFSSVALALDNPFLTREQMAILELTSDDIEDGIFYLHKDWRSTINPETRSDSKVYRAVMGLRGELLAGNRDLNWELTLNRGVSSSNISKTRVNAKNFARAMNAVRNESGEIVCASAPQDCVPFNPFGLQASPEAIDYITQNALDRGTIGQTVVTASLRGSAADLDGGSLIYVVGAEHRREDAEYIQADIVEPRSSKIDQDDEIEKDFSNAFHTNELFFEAVAPVIGDDVIPLLSKLELEANWRGIDNSRAGVDNTWSVGGRMTFDSDNATLVARGNFGRSVRAPSLFEFFRPFTLVETALNDPCDRNSFLEGGGNTTRERVCSRQAAELAAPYNSGEFDALIPDAAPLRLGGTPDLRNEQADSYTVGLVMDFHREKPLRFSADMINIEITDAIVERDLDRLARRCYDLDIRSDCDLFVREERTFQLFAIRNAYENIGEISLNAIQYNLLFGFDFGDQAWVPGEFTLDVSAYNLREFTERDRETIVDRVGTLDYPKKRASTSLIYSLGGFEFAWNSHYTGEVEYTLPFESQALIPPRIPSYWLHHISMSYAFGTKVKARFGVRNVLDSDPPNGLPSSEVGTTYDALGRYYSAGLNLSF